MRLPLLLVLTDRTQCDRPLADVVAVAVDSGARAVVLREKDLPDDDRDRLAERLLALLAPVGGVLVRAGAAGAAGASAVHLSATDPLPRPRPALVGRSCHSGREVAEARAEGCDYIMISPVFPTASKPGYGPALGPAGLASLIRGAPPAYALGGVGPADVGQCLDAGARGIAVMGPIMRNPGSVQAYLTALQDAAASERSTGREGADRSTDCR